jgi:hypothetical protein
MATKLARDTYPDQSTSSGSNALGLLRPKMVTLKLSRFATWAASLRTARTLTSTTMQRWFSIGAAKHGSPTLNGGEQALPDQASNLPNVAARQKHNVSSCPKFIKAWQNDLDAFESALYATDIELG